MEPSPVAGGVTDHLLEDLTAALGAAYQIERELPGGGMSRVFVARERALGREVVVKVLPPELAAGINRDRFRREVQLAAQLSHPYIVPLLHAGEAGELLWFTMPYIAGTSLRDRLQSDGPLSVREVVRLTHDVVEALVYAHSRGVIHRDIKPGNILSDGRHAMVTDFGVAKALGAALPFTGVAGHTTSGMAIGTPAYMAPEQLAADPSADHRVDIYAVGLLVYELLAGASPFDAPSPTATMTAQLTRTPPSLVTVRPDVPPTLAAMVAHCLQKNPDDRPADAAAVLSELEAIDGAMRVDAHLGGEGERTRAAAPASPWPLVVAGVGMVALIGAGLWAIGIGRGPAPGPAVVETLPVQAPRDDEQGTALPAIPTVALTHADSLAIAAALRDELERIDPEQAARRTVPSESTLSRQVSFADSLVRARLAMIIGSGDRGTSLNRSTSNGIGATPGSQTVRRIMIVATPPRGGDQGLIARGDSLAASLRARLGDSDGWNVVLAPPGGFSESGGTPPADVLMTVGMARVDGDSIMLRVGIRNLEPGSDFGYRVIASGPVPDAGSDDAFRSTLRDVFGTLNSIERMGRGSRWQFDMGRRPPPRPEQP